MRIGVEELRLRNLGFEFRNNGFGLGFEFRNRGFKNKGLIGRWQGTWRETQTRMTMLSQAIWTHRIGAHGFFPAPKLTDLYRNLKKNTLNIVWLP